MLSGEMNIFEQLVLTEQLEKRFFLCSMFIAQEIHRLIVSLHLFLYTHSVWNSWSLIIPAAIQWLWQLPKSNCAKSLFLSHFPRNHVP